MVRALNRLSAREVATLLKPGRHFDDGGLCLFISPDCSRKRWTFQFRWQGRKCEMGRGSPRTAPLAKARELAATARLTVQNGSNPLEEKRAALDAQRRSVEEQQQSRSKARTFGQIADDLIEFMVMKSLFTRMNADGITSHGFRSTFRDWAGEVTSHPREVCEAALAHAVELAYQRGDALDKRRVLMCDWARSCDGAMGSRIVPGVS